ncbi:YqhA family protein [Aliarcobacter thereius]|uniref:YqhA family protein n=1 Tax=Aliarcobacter thereius TaxID=544718 RepID=A0A5R9HF29_9BACT|nr:YqhA family protein [Aliarcobacter thereius]TLS91569.1 YqhA family protein [Aliarcobacter thereius]TLT08788.1 YqhA family protein [Aliarcobacter thereius]
MSKFLENSLWKSRFIVILAVIFSFMGSVILFLVASIDVINVAKMVITSLVSGIHPEHFHEDIVSGVIEAIDLYLIAIVLLIFSFGVYELFISKIDAACSPDDCNSVLNISSLDQLKDKIAKVIIMVLVVNYFQRVLHTSYETPLELLYFALAIVALAIGLYFTGKVGKK